MEVTEFVRKDPYISHSITLEFKDHEELKKRFYRESVKKIAEHIVSNGLCIVREERDPFLDAERISVHIRMYGRDNGSPVRLRILDL